MKIDYIEVTGVTLDQVIDIATKASISVVKGMLGRPQISRTEEGDIRWGVQSKDGLTIFRIRTLPADRGFRVEGWAEEVRAASSWGQLNPYAADGRARQLVRSRRRTLNAIARAGQAAAPASREGDEQLAGAPDTRL
jgi:hypothetical protein